MHLLPPTPNPNTDPELTFQLTLLRIDYLQRTESHEAAYNAIEDLGELLEAEEADIYQRIHVMVLKALLFARVGKPQKGFTVAMRAANAAWQSRILPALWEAWGAIANILGALGEWEAQRRILEGVIPQVCDSYPVIHVSYFFHFLKIRARADGGPGTRLRRRRPMRPALRLARGRLHGSRRRCYREPATASLVRLKSRSTH